ncbi:MAG: DUF1080 domain-containing protein [Akkermansiaceae bacterium]
MKTILLLSLLSTLAPAAPKPLFNGKDLAGWEGNTDLWSVKDGAIVGRTTPEQPASTNTFLIWKGGEPADFELTLQFKMTPGDAKNYVNSGIQFRSKIVDPEKFVVAGYQADFEYGPKYSGILYEEKGRGILAQRGQEVKITQGEKPAKPEIEVMGETGKSDEIQAAINKDGWNEYRVVAKGNHIQQFINGKLTVDVTDETAEAAKSGVIAFQLHTGPPMQVEFKDIVLTEK